MKAPTWSYALVFLLFATSAEAAVYWVSATGGTTAGSCGAAQSETDPSVYFRTIAGGMACLSANDTLMVKSGNYNERLVDPLPNGATMRGADSTAANWPVIKPQNNVVPHNADTIYINSARTVRITFKFIKVHLSLVTSGNRPSGCWGTSDAARDSPITIEDFECIGPASGMAGDTAGALGVKSNWIVRRGLIENWISGMDHPSNNPGAHGFYHQGANSIIENVVVRNVNGRGVNFRTGIVQENNLISGLYVDGAAVGITMTNQTGGTIGTNNRVFASVFRNAGRNEIEQNGNTFVNNTIYGSSISCLRIQGTNHTVRNNIVLGCGSTPIVNESTGSTLSNNLTTGAAASIFVDHTNGNFHLLDTATGAIDQGVNLGSPYNVDYDGVTRPSSGAWEIGAFEFVEEPPAAPRSIRIGAGVRMGSGVRIGNQ